MKHNSCVALILPLITFALATFGQDSRRRPGDVLPPTGTGDLFVTPNPRDIPKTLKDLVDRSDIVVEGTVSRVLASRETSPRALETDAVVQVLEIFKGKLSATEIVISQRGGNKDGVIIRPVQYSLVQPGTRCLWFLKNDVRADLPALPLMGRFHVTGVWSGMLCSENNKIEVRVPRPDPFRLQYQGRSIDEVKSELSSLLGIVPKP